MDLNRRKRFQAILKASSKSYLESLSESQRLKVNFESRFIQLQHQINIQLRKESGSANSLKLVPRLSRLVFGLQEDIRRLRLPIYKFEFEQEIINHFVIELLETRRSSQYSGECEFYGETLLNLYLDIFISLTCWKTPRQIESKPGYLRNPKSGQLLELDIILEDFNLAFEFQGESHYRKPREIEKDQIKLKICAENKIILVPVNIFQLKSDRLMNLIVNSIKDSLGLHSLFGEDFQKGVIGERNFPTRGRHVLAFKKSTQRLYLAKTVLGVSIVWLDGYAARFRETQASRNPVSSATEAPRLFRETPDLELDYIYHRLRRI